MLILSLLTIQKAKKTDPKWATGWQKGPYNKIWKDPGSIRPVFGLKILENMKLFNVLEFYSHYKDITPLHLKTCLKF